MLSLSTGLLNDAISFLILGIAIGLLALVCALILVIGILFYVKQYVVYKKYKQVSF